MSVRATASFVLLALVPAVTADVLVVGPAAGPGVDFVEVADAVAAASDGDLVLVRPGTYAQTVVIDAKRVSIVADLADESAPKPRVLALEPLRVENLAADQDVFVRGLALEAVPDTSANQNFAGLLVVGCAGTVLVENCELLGSGASPGLGALPGARVAVSAGGVEFVRCTLEGGAGFFFAPGFWGPTPGGPGLVVQDSRVVLHGCDVRGGRGGDGSFDAGCVFVGCSAGSEGGAGVQLVHGTGLVVHGTGLVVHGTGLVVHGSSVVAGDSGNGTGPGTLEGTPGTDAIAASSAADVQVRASTFVGGAGGVGDVSTGASGAAFDPTLSPVFVSGVARVLAIRAPVRAGTDASARLDGAPGDLSVFWGAAQTSSAAVLAVAWPLLLGPPAFPSAQIAGVGPSGFVEFSFAVPPSLGADEHRFSYCQGVAANVFTGTYELSSPTVAVVLAPGF